MTDFYNKKAVLFDLDGTVIDSMEGIFNALYYMFERVGVTVKSKDELYRFIGPSIGSMLKSGYSFGEQEADDAVQIYREYYSTKGLLECRAYNGITRLFKKLKKQGKKIALATKKPEVFSVKILKNLGFDEYFDVISGATLDDSHNSKTEIINRAVELLGVDKSDAVMVGDTKYDVIGANNAGVDCIGVLYGYGKKDVLLENGATKIANDMTELTQILTGVD